MLGSAFRSAVEAADHPAVVAALAPEVVLHSPVSFKPFEGRDSVANLLGIIVEVFEDFRYTDQVENGDTAMLVFRARIGDKQVEGLDLLRFGADGKIRDFTVMVRPMSAVIALAEAVGPRLAAKT